MQAINELPEKESEALFKIEKKHGGRHSHNIQIRSQLYKK